MRFASLFLTLPYFLHRVEERQVLNVKVMISLSSIEENDAGTKGYSSYLSKG